MRGPPAEGQTGGPGDGPPARNPAAQGLCVPGRLEWTVTFTELPETCRQSGSVTITLQTSEGRVTARLPADIWRRLEHAAKDHPQWVAMLRGSLAHYRDGEIALTHPALSVTTPIPTPPAGAPTLPAGASTPPAPVAAEPTPPVRGVNAARAGCSRANATGRAAHLALEKKGPERGVGGQGRRPEKAGGVPSTASVIDASRYAASNQSLIQRRFQRAD